MLLPESGNVPLSTFRKRAKNDKSNFKFKDFSNIVVVHCTVCYYTEDSPIKCEN